MKVFVDTNVWLAGRFGRGLCADLLAELVDTPVEILLDERVLAEFHRIARDKFRVDTHTLEESMLFFRNYTVIMAASETASAGIPDPDDARIIAAALTARADLFITGDKALLALDAVERMPLLDPRAAYLRLRGLA